MMRALSFVVPLFFLSVAVASAQGFASPVRDEILASQGAADVSSLDCEKVTSEQASRLGQAFYSDQIGTEDLGRLVEIPEDVRKEIFGNMGLTFLGCLEGGDPIPLPEGMEQYAQANPAQAVPMMQENFTTAGFIAAWTTLLWMFSAIGFGVFMVWITSSKFRLQFRKMAEGDFEDDGKAMDILKERYARGEITKEQFEKMRRDLMI